MRGLRTKPLRLVAAVLGGSLAFSGVAFAASLDLSTNKLHAWSQTLTTGTCNQTSTATTEADTYVQQANATSTAGATATTLSITNGTSGQNYAFIRWDLSGCGLPTTGGANSATLSVFVTTAASGHTISVFPVYSSWSSSTLNWNGVSGLTIGGTATGTFSSANGAHSIAVTADVDAAIKAGALWGWELRDTATSGAGTTKIGSFQNGTAADRPTLTVSDEQ